MRRMRVLDHRMLVELNEKSIRDKRNQNVKPEQIPSVPAERYWVTEQRVRERDGKREMRLCVVLGFGRSAWLDVAAEDAVGIPEVEVSETEWEMAMCAGTPPAVP